MDKKTCEINQSGTPGLVLTDPRTGLFSLELDGVSEGSVAPVCGD